ncbi:YfhO family protein [Lentibacillus sediminis]|uniref:YfhO family protein n=1 Tax=Lentibacillus sediminis TaxID=1940529 RepID=UPI000C1C719D|nr:YfhO family protein [Lentibacillus sediminis]
MKKMQKIGLLIGSSLVISFLAHAFFIYQGAQGVYMAGPNDGLNQMVPFRQLMYEQLKDGNFSYAFDFGIGGSTATQLAYYYGINTFFFLTAGVVFLLETLSIIGEPEVLFWAQATVYISVFRLAIVICITTGLFRYMKMNPLPSFIGAVLYGASTMYFRHVTYWEFFADAFIWLPLLILGVEKIIRERKPAWLIAATAISFFDNFYFAYINGIFTGVYIVGRWLFPLVKQEAGKLVQAKYYSISVLLGFGIGSVGFIPAVWGFFHNQRPPFEQEIPLVDGTSNILYDSYLLIVPAIFVLLIGCFPLYRKPAFRFFTVLSLFFIVLHFIPWAASFFNGFSAPRHRYEYLAAFTIGGAVAAGLPYLKRMPRRQIMYAAIWMAAAYFIFYVTDPTFEITGLSTASYVILAGIVLVLAFFLNNQKAWYALLASIVISQLILGNQFQYKELFIGGGVENTTKEYILSSNYYSEEQQALIDEVLAADSDALSRITWIADGRNNTPIIQGFPGTSLYSSILNGHVLEFYYHDLRIDMKRESVSRYSMFGDRANLHSMLRGKYAMYEKGAVTNAPYGFEPYMESENYVVYQNTNILPFVRMSDAVYSEASLAEQSVLEREQAMLHGIVVKDAETTAEGLPQKENLIDEAGIDAVGGTYSGGQLKVTAETGGLDITIPEGVDDAGTEDYYVSFYLRHNVKEASGFALHVNDFQTSRKSRQSLYKTGVNEITIRVPKPENQTISIRVPAGNYTLENLEVYPENYQTLENVKQEANQRSEVTLEGNSITIENLQANQDGYLAIPVPYEKGWKVQVDGESRDLEQVNYAFLGTAIQAGDDTVTFTYHPPFFRTTLFVMAGSLVASVIWVKRKRKRGI